MKRIVSAPALVIAALVGFVGGALAEDRSGDHEPLERKHRLAPMRELKAAPDRTRGLSERDDSANPYRDDDQSAPKHDKSDARGGGRSRADDEDE